MYFRHLKLKNWRNFVNVDLTIGERLFITGPNASGKSNLLDVFRFLRDIAKTGGGLQQAVRERGDLSKIRCLAARRYPNVEIEVTLTENGLADATEWRYGIGLHQESRGARRLLLRYEKIWRNNELILNRPDDDDRKDDWRLTETHLEHLQSNINFRPIDEAFKQISYLHLVPQLLRHPNIANRDAVGEDPFGLKFLDRVISTPEKTRRARLHKIEEALRIAVPELKNLTDTPDERGMPHLEAIYEHWRPNAGRQREDQFSDGTLRLIGLLWMLLEGAGLLLLEEPELSLHSAVVSKLPALIWRLQRPRKRQVILSSHSTELFGVRGIRPEEVALLKPHGSEGTVVSLASDKEEIRLLLEGGMTIADAVLPLTAPSNVDQLDLFK
ncbi:MAG: chromosome segregation protein SMC [Nitrospirae bacterium]|nr:MAG: chromosome segregation protein SMC [Nitrospirota bacterium]